MCVIRRNLSNSSQEKSEEGPSSLAKSMERRPPIRAKDREELGKGHTLTNRLAKRSRFTFSPNRLKYSRAVKDCHLLFLDSKDFWMLLLASE